MQVTHRVVLSAAVLLSLVLVPARVVADPGPFSGLIGAWRGAGELRLDSGQSEKLRCQAYYTQREAAHTLGLAIRCASPSYTIELRSQLTASGSVIQGTWEERTFNAAGDVTGEATANVMKLAIKGGGFTGNMSVQTNGSQQSVVVDTSGNALKGVTIRLTKG